MKRRMRGPMDRRWNAWRRGSLSLGRMGRPRTEAPSRVKSSMAAGCPAATFLLTQQACLLRLELRVGDHAAVAQIGQTLELAGHVRNAGRGRRRGGGPGPAPVTPRPPLHDPLDP